jgi:predicted subunit of tRNA(5-methylaminomethyl-2-thiouridylate) methyltransferase
VNITHPPPEQGEAIETNHIGFKNLETMSWDDIEKYIEELNLNKEKNKEEIAYCYETIIEKYASKRLDSRRAREAYLGCADACYNIEDWKHATLRSVFIIKYLDSEDALSDNMVKRIINSHLRLSSNKWEADGRTDFEHIELRMINAIVNDTEVLIRSDPVREEATTILDEHNQHIHLRIGENVEIFDRSESKEVINGYNVYWYKIRTRRGLEGWTYGRFLSFYPLE